MKKKRLLIICIIVVIILLIGSFFVIINNTSTNKGTTNSKIIQDNDVDIDSNVDEESSYTHSSEKLEEQESGYTHILEEKKEEDKSYEHNSKKEDISNKETNKSNDSSSSENKTITESNTNSEIKEDKSSSDNSNKQNNNNEETKPSAPSIPENNDEAEWEEFINDPETKRILGGHITDLKSANEAQAKMIELAGYGYDGKWIDTCIILSTGKRCVYGVIAIVEANTCENNPELTYNWWSYDHYVDIITYLKSLGYACEGKSW